MKRRRIVNLLLAVACVVMACVTLKQYSVPIVPAADAQGGRQPAASPPISAFKIAPPPVRKAAAAAIRAQLDAFGKGDYQTAVKYQSRNLRGNFATVDRFRQMITTNYPEFAHYRSVQFGEMRSDPKGDHVFVPVTLVGQDGVTINALYSMVRESTGYKIDGVGGGGRLPPSAAPGSAIDV